MNSISLKTAFLSATLVCFLGIGLTPVDADAGKLRGKTKTSVNKNVNQNRNKNRNTNINVNSNRNRNTNVNVNKNVDIDVDVDRRGNPIVRGMAIGATAAVTAAVIGSIVYTLPPSCTTVIVNGVTYQQCGSTWYQPQVVSGTTQYVVINAPQ